MIQRNEEKQQKELKQPKKRNKGEFSGYDRRAINAWKS